MLSINDVFIYEAETGYVKYKISRGPCSKGDIAGSLRKDGYVRIKFQGKQYYSHVLAWYLHYNRWPIKEIDHKNRIRHDNRIDNLREASDIEQRANTNHVKSENGKYVWKKKHIKWHRKCPYYVVIDRKQVGPYVQTLDEAIYVRDMYLQSCECVAN